MRISKEQLKALIQTTIKEQYQKPDVKAGLDKARASKEKKDVQSRRANMKASARGMNEANGVDEHAAEELKLYIDNTSALYNQKKSIIANLKKKAARGVYDHELATKLWLYLVVAGAKMFVKEFNSSMKAADRFPKATRIKVAKDFADEYKDIVSGTMPEQVEQPGNVGMSSSPDFGKQRKNIARFLGDMVKLRDGMQEYANFLSKENKGNQDIVQHIEVSLDHLLESADRLAHVLGQLDKKISK